MENQKNEKEPRKGGGEPLKLEKQVTTISTSGESWGVANQSVAFTSNSGIKCVGHKPQIKHDRNMDMITRS